MKIGTTTHLIPQNIAPPNAKNLAIFNGETKVCNVPLGHLSMPNVGNKLYSVGMLSDVHMSTENTSSPALMDFPVCLQYYNKNANFVCVCGDGVADGTAENFLLYQSLIDANSNIPVYSITGNHETYSGLSGSDYLNDEATIKSLIKTYWKLPLYYTISSNPTTETDENGVIADGGNIYNSSIGENDIFIMVGIAKDWAHFGTGGLQWLYETLEANRNKRCFLFEHINPDDASGNGCKIQLTDIWSGAQSIVFENLMKHYKNVIFFHGHTHMTFYLQTRTNIANIDEIYGRYSIHIPSATYPRNVVNGEKNNLVAESEGYLMEVYENHIVLRGRDFVDGVFIPVAQYCLDTTLKNIEAGTFNDSTGTIIKK